MPLNLGSSLVDRISRVIVVRKAPAVFFIASLFLSSFGFAQNGTVQSKLSASTITRDESVTLEITAIGIEEELDLSSLNKDFDVLERSSSREFRSVVESGGGLRTSSIVTWAIELVPRGTGIFTVPPVQVGTMSSQAHTLTVNELPTGAGRDIFVEAFVDTNTPWVQSQVVMTLKVFQAIEIVDGGLGMPEGENLIVERLGDDVRTNERRDGRQYTVTTRRFALFPQKSGPMILEPITLSVSVPADPSRARGFFSPTRKLTRRSDKIELDVKPRPNTDMAWWLPAKAVQLEAQWVDDVSTAEVDQPLTRTIVLRASGVTDSQLPDINMPNIDDASLYAEEPERKLGANAQGLISELAIKWAVIPQKAGELSLPPVSVDWFNTTTGRVETAVLPAQTLTVRGNRSTTGSDNDRQDNTRTTKQADANTELMDGQGGTQSASITAATPTATRSQSSTQTVAGMQSRLQRLESSVGAWRNAALFSLLLWCVSIVVVSLILFKRAKQWNGANASLKQLGAVRNSAIHSFSGMQPLGGVPASCKTGKPDDIRRALLEWAARQWADNPPSTLGALARRLSAGPARSTIESLDALLYNANLSAQERESALARLPSLPDDLKAAHEAGQLQKKSKTLSGQVSSANSLPSL